MSKHHSKRSRTIRKDTKQIRLSEVKAKDLDLVNGGRAIGGFEGHGGGTRPPWA
jgi:hypothetical protein